MYRNEIALTLVVAALCGIPCSVAGQSKDPAGGTSTESVDTVAVTGDALPSVAPWKGPSARAAILLAPPRAPRPLLVAAPRSTPVTPQVRNRRGVPYMVAGGILFIAGAIVEGEGGTLLMIGGAGIGAYGAYIYFGG